MHQLKYEQIIKYLNYLNRLKASKMKANILKQTPMSSTQNKPIPIKPLRVSRVIPHYMPVQQITHFSHPQRHSGVPGFRMIHRVQNQHSYIIHTPLVNQIFKKFFIFFNFNIFIIIIISGSFKWECFFELFFPWDFVVLREGFGNICDGDNLG